MNNHTTRLSKWDILVIIVFLTFIGFVLVVSSKDIVLSTVALILSASFAFALGLLAHRFVGAKKVRGK